MVRPKTSSSQIPPPMGISKTYYPRARYLKVDNKGGFTGFFRRLWYQIVANWIGFKWLLVDLFTKHCKLKIEDYRRSGDIAVITGGGRGIGLQVIKKLLEADMHVIVGARNVQATKKTIEQLTRRHQITTGSFEVFGLDLMSFSSVREFTHEILQKDCPVHLLINNAGIMLTPYVVTPNEQESQFQVNYLSHFLLTCNLLPKLIEAGLPNKHSRIVNVTSAAHYGGELDFDDLQMFKFYSPAKAYMDSKLAQVLFTNYLNNFIIHKYQEDGNSFSSSSLYHNVYSVHPGIILTDLYRHVCIMKTFGCLLKFIFKSEDEGADGIVYAAFAEEVETTSGLFLSNCKVYSENPVATNLEVQKKLWNVSRKMVGLEEQVNIQTTNEEELFQLIDINAEIN